MIIIGHRGASGYAPEHTFAAWDLALDMGVDYIEQDLQMTADGILIVLHDETLDRTTSGTCQGPVNRKSFADLQRCDAGTWFNRTFPERARDHFIGQRIPSLDQVLTRYAGRARFYVETKKPASAPGMEEALLDLLASHRLRPTSRNDSRVIIQSFSAASLIRISAADPDIPLVQLLSRRETSWTIRRRLGTIREYACGIGPQFRSVDDRLIAAVHELGMVIHPYTVNDEPVMHRLARAGVDGMFTDFPDILARVCGRP
jgi:glycerophosphoryl diester phosphodiesterase